MGYDESGNQNACTINAAIGNASLSCYDFFTIEGFVKTEYGDPIRGVSLSLIGATTIQITADTTGYYRFEDVLEGQDYTLVAEKDIGDVNGATTFDLILMQKHILDIQLLDSPYKIIAADVNHSDIVSTFDLLRLRKLILGVTSELENNTSWRFVAADYVFSNPLMPLDEDFPEMIPINALPDDTVINITGIKIGDVNNTVDLSE